MKFVDDDDDDDSDIGLYQLRGLGYVVVFLSRDVISVSRGGGNR